MIRACVQTDSTADFRTRIQLAGFRKQTAHTAIPGDGRGPSAPRGLGHNGKPEMLFEIGDTLDRVRVLARTKREAADTLPTVRPFGIIHLVRGPGS